MHPSALQNSKDFFDRYARYIISSDRPRVIEIGSQDVNGSIRTTCPSQFEYIGVDYVAGKGVDVVLTDPYQLPFDADSADIILSSSCFEHAELFWLTFLEIMRVVKPSGLFYLNVPSNGNFHRWPVDCWRFYPDSGRALVTWATRCGMNVALLESYTSSQIGDQWNDYVAVFLKDKANVSQYPDRILHHKQSFSNGVVYGSEQILRFSELPEDKLKMAAIAQILNNQLKVV